MGFRLFYCYCYLVLINMVKIVGSYSFRTVLKNQVAFLFTRLTDVDEEFNFTTPHTSWRRMTPTDPVNPLASESRVCHQMPDNCGAYDYQGFPKFVPYFLYKAMTFRPRFGAGAFFNQGAGAFFNENFLLKNLTYNQYGVMESGFISYTTGLNNGSISPKVEAFLSSKEEFTWEIEICTPVRDKTTNAINDVTIEKRQIKVKGLNIPNQKDSTLNFVEKQVSLGLIEYVYQHREYWNDKTFNYAVNDDKLRTVQIQKNNLGLPSSPAWQTNTLGQLLDIAIYT